jgi:hypothetical protein
LFVENCGFLGTPSDKAEVESQTKWVFWLLPFSGILNTGENNVSKTGSVSDFR